MIFIFDKPASPQNSLIHLSFNHLLENVSLCLSSSLNWRPGVRHSTFESLRLGRSSQSIASGVLHFWDSLNFKKDREFVGITVLFLDEKVNSVIHGFTPVGRANHYMPSLKADSIVKIDRYEVVRCSSMYKITDHPFLICFISLTIIDEVITGAPEINLQSRLYCSTISK
uniref:Replication protein A 70 kDa DNA-binding subunit B/D first OB fold domain-containing protein n=1 Tax=Brassica oleracea var. oleracea TaxID=109376 RepID=A0A0D3EF07_BRAOL